MTLPRLASALVALACLCATLEATPADLVDLDAGAHVVLIGNGLGSRMVHFGHFETELHLRYPGHRLLLRNMCDEGNTPSFRPHSGRSNQLGFPGAEAFHAPYADGNIAAGIGHFATEEEWLTTLEPDVILAFFGFNESFGGRAGIENFRGELDAFLAHTLQQTYGNDTPPQLVLISPIAFEDRSDKLNVPDGTRKNANLAAYTAVMDGVAAEHDVLFVNAFNASLGWYASSVEPLTADGALLNATGYELFSAFLVDSIFDTPARSPQPHRTLVHDAVMEKNWFWINDFKIPNGVHVFGRRHDPFGPDNYPFELTKIREMTAIRDHAIWEALHGRVVDLAERDAETSTLPPVETNYTPGGKSTAPTFLEGEAARAMIRVPEGYAIEQWATEKEFPDLANPVQLSFDNAGRLWVATMPSYPHYRPGDPRPDDKLLILEDTDGDGKADKQTVFADGLHLPMGFEFAPEGVYLSQGINLVLLRDRDGDDRADEREIIFSGFDDHDTHHAISAFATDPSGALFMCEGVFLRTNVETPYGPVRGTNGGFYRFAPQRRHLERHAQLSIPNPWGVAFDAWGQHFFLHTSGATTEWMLPGTIKPRYGVSTPGSRNLIEPAHRVRPTSGIEFLSSRHFPDDVQGDMLLNNNIGFLGTKQHRMLEDGTGFDTRWRQDLTSSTDSNYRPVDIEVAPDGSLYLVDWHNPLIGHMQHNARDPLRDHAHGRIYRVTYPSRPLVEPAQIAGAPIDVLLENLKLPEDRSRSRTRRELRGRDADAVLAALDDWVGQLDANDPNHEHHLLEALWVTWGLDRVDETLLRRVLRSEDHRARAAAVRVLRYSGHRIPEHVGLLREAAKDEHGRVKLEAIVAASWLERDEGTSVLEASTSHIEPAPADDGPQHVVLEDRGRRITLRHPAIARSAVSDVTMTVRNDAGIINLAELEIMSEGHDVTQLATLRQSSEYNDGMYPIANLVDGELGNFSHTSTEENPWIAVHFDPPRVIDAIKIWNRPGYETRFSPAQIVFTSADGAKLAELDVKIESPSIFGDPWLDTPYLTAQAHLNNQSIVEERIIDVPAHLAATAREQFLRGAEIYERDGHCSTCHQPDGQGLTAAGFPPLADTVWATQDEERLIKLTLHGLLGPIDVKGRTYPGLVPMTPFGALLDDDEIADVLTYVRNAFGNNASIVKPDTVRDVRAATLDKVGFYSPEELLGGAATHGRGVVNMWEVSDFDGAFAVPLRRRDFARGEEMFTVASCSKCHNVQGQGGAVGADLTAVATNYTEAEILLHILQPSLTIDDSHRMYAVDLTNGLSVVGLIVGEDGDALQVIENLYEPDDVTTVPLDEVREKRALMSSAMPPGLLVTLTSEEILDLVAYVAANGNRKHAAFAK